MSLLCPALYTKCPYCALLYMQSVLTVHCFICKVSLFYNALYAKCHCYALLYMKSVLIFYCVVCRCCSSSRASWHCAVRTSRITTAPPHASGAACLPTMAGAYVVTARSGPPPSSLTVFSTFISRKIGEDPIFRQIGRCLAEFPSGLVLSFAGYL